MKISPTIAASTTRRINFLTPEPRLLSSSRRYSPSESESLPRPRKEGPVMRDVCSERLMGRSGREGASFRRKSSLRKSSRRKSSRRSSSRLTSSRRKSSRRSSSRRSSSLRASFTKMFGLGLGGGESKSLSRSPERATPELDLRGRESSGVGSEAFAPAVARTSVTPVPRRSLMRRSMRAPHCPQNLYPASFTWLHDGQFNWTTSRFVRRSAMRRSRRTPHIPQKRFSARLSVPQKLHTIMPRVLLAPPAEHTPASSSSVIKMSFSAAEAVNLSCIWSTI